MRSNVKPCIYNVFTAPTFENLVKLSISSYLNVKGCTISEGFTSVMDLYSRKIINYTMDCGLFGVRFLLLGIKRELLLHRCLLIYFATAPLNSLKTVSYSCEKILFLFHRKVKSCIIMKSDSGICTNIPSFNSCSTADL